MKMIKTIMAGAAALVAFIASVTAADFGPAPAGYESAIKDYVHSRLVSPQAAKFRFESSPYKVYADLAGYEGLPAWAVDIRVRARLDTGDVGGYVPYTVIFVGGDPVALRGDLRRFTRL